MPSLIHVQGSWIGLKHGCLMYTDCIFFVLQNVQPGKLFSKELAVQQLLRIIDGVTMADNGRFIAWDGRDIPF